MPSSLKLKLLQSFKAGVIISINIQENLFLCLYRKATALILAHFALCRYNNDQNWVTVLTCVFPLDILLVRRDDEVRTSKEVAAKMRGQERVIWVEECEHRGKTIICVRHIKNVLSNNQKETYRFFTRKGLSSQKHPHGFTPTHHQYCAVTRAFAPSITHTHVKSLANMMTNNSMWLRGQGFGAPTQQL